MSYNWYNENILELLSRDELMSLYKYAYELYKDIYNDPLNQIQRYFPEPWEHLPVQDIVEKRATNQQKWWMLLVLKSQIDISDETKEKLNAKKTS